MAGEQDARVLVGYKVDGPSVAAAIAANKNVAVSYETVTSAAATFSPEVLALNPQLAALAAQEQQVVTANERVAGSNTQVAESYIKVASASEQALTAQSKRPMIQIDESTARQGAGRIAGLGSIVGSAGGQQFREASQVVQLATSFGVAGAAAGGLAIIMQRQAEAADKAREAELRKLNAQAEVAEFIATSTEQEKRDRLASLQEQRVILLGALERQRADLRDAQDQLIPAAGFLNSIVSPEIVGQAQAAEEALKNTGAALGSTAEQQAGLEIALRRGTITAADLADAEDKLKDVRKQAADAIKGALDDDATFRLHAAAERRNGNAEALKEELQANLDRVALIDNYLIPSYVRAGLSTLGLINEGNRLTAQNELLLQSVLPVIEAREREAKAAEALSTQTQNYLDAVTLEIKIREELSATVQKINDITAETSAKLLELQGDTQERRIEIEADAADRIAQITADSADRVARILRDSGREQAADRARRDVTAFLQSKLHAKDALDDEHQSQQKQIDNLAKSLAKQEAQLDRSYAKQERQLINSTDKQLAIERQHQAQLQVNLQNAVAAEQAIALNGSGGLRIIHQNYWADLNNIAVTYAANTVNTVRSILNGAGGISSLLNGASGNALMGGGFAATAFNRAFDQRFGQRMAAIYAP